MKPGWLSSNTFTKFRRTFSNMGRRVSLNDENDIRSVIQRYIADFRIPSWSFSPPQGRGNARAPNVHRQNTGRRNNDDAYDLQIGTSKDFESYYQSQNLLEPEEWDEFISVAKSPLPTTFRITASRIASKAVNDHVEQEFVPFLSNVVFEGAKQPPPRKLKWYPGGFAWQLDTAKHVVRKSPEFAKYVLVHLTRRFDAYR